MHFPSARIPHVLVLLTRIIVLLEVWRFREESLKRTNIRLTKYG